MWTEGRCHTPTVAVPQGSAGPGNPRALPPLPRVPPLAVHASPSPAPHSRRHAARGPSPRLPSPGTCVYRSAVSFGDLRAHLLSSPDDPPLSGGPQRVSPSARPTVAAKFWQLREKLLQTSARTPAFSLWANRRRGARPPGPSARARWIQRPQTASRAGHRLHPAGGAWGLSWPRVLAGGR